MVLAALLMSSRGIFDGVKFVHGIEDVSKENLIKELPKFDGVTLRVAKLGPEILSNCKKLKVISRHGVGYDNVDLKYLKSNNIKNIKLPVSAPFHCSLMKPAAEKLKLFLQKTDFKNPSLHLISNVTALPVKKDEDIKGLLYKQIFSQVRWRESVEFMIKNGINDFIEIGPGKVLSGLVKRTNDKVYLLYTSPSPRDS